MANIFSPPVFGPALPTFEFGTPIPTGASPVFVMMDNESRERRIKALEEELRHLYAQRPNQG
jgi:hypothetical protein